MRFWFRAAPDTTDHPSEDKQASVAQEFFKELVSPKDFPRGKIKCLKTDINVSLYILSYRLCRFHKENYETYATQLQNNKNDRSRTQAIGRRSSACSTT